MFLEPVVLSVMVSKLMIIGLTTQMLLALSVPLKRTPKVSCIITWLGFSVFQISAPDDIERLQPETRDVNARAPNAPIRLKFPSEQTASEGRAS